MVTGRSAQAIPSRRSRSLKKTLFSALVADSVRVSVYSPGGCAKNRASGPASWVAFSWDPRFAAESMVV